MLAYIQDGLHGVRHYVAEGVPLLGVGNVTEEGIDLTEVNRIGRTEHERLAASHVHRGDLLITITGRIGTAAVYDSDEPANLSAHVALGRPKSPQSLLYLKYYLASRFGTASLTKAQIGSTHPHINVRRLAELPIPLPPPEIQREIAASMEAARETRNAKLRRADALLASLDAYLLDTLGLTPVSPDERAIFAVRLEKVKGKRIDPPAYRPFFAKDKPPKTPLRPLAEIAAIHPHSMKPVAAEALVPYVGLPECDLTEVREVAMRPYKEVKGRNIVRPGDILFARIEPSVFNKKYVLVEDLKGHDYAYTSTEFYVVKPREAVNLYYLYAMFFCSFVFAQAKGKTTGSSGRRRLDPEMFAALQIPLAERDVQQQIAVEVLHRRKEARRLRAEAESDWSAAKHRFEMQLLSSDDL